MFDQVVNKWLALPIELRRIDYDHVYKYQCVDWILEVLYEVDGIGSGVWGNAIDYWNKPTATLQLHFDPVYGSDAVKGDLVVLKTRGYNGDPKNDPGDGHVGWATGNINGTQLEISEQNGSTGNGEGLGGDAIRTRWVDRSRVAGMWRRKVAVAPAAPGPTPAAGTLVHLPASVASWAAYRRGSGLRKGTSDQVGTLAPSKFGGLTYPVEGWVGDYGVNITTQTYGQVTIWVKGTSAEFLTATPPAAVPAPALPYTITEYSSPVKYKVTPNHSKWNLAHEKFADIAADPKENSGPEGKVIEVKATLRHTSNPNYLYYLEDPNVPQGWNSLDTEPYVPKSTMADYTPIPFPAAEKYTLVVTVPGFATAEDARLDQDAKHPVDAGDYYVYERDGDMVNITKSAAVKGMWINPAQNVAPVVPAEPEDDVEEEIPVHVEPSETSPPAEQGSEAPAGPETPEPEKTSPPEQKPVDESWKRISFFRTDRLPVLHITTNLHTYPVSDFVTGQHVGNLAPHRQLHIVGTFEKNGIMYAVTYEAYINGAYLNIPYRSEFVKIDKFGAFLESMSKIKKSLEGIIR